jgi:hypothetical protein
MWYLWCICDIFCLFGWNSKNKLRWCILVTLPSVTLGKEVLCRVPGSYHSAEKQHLGTGKASLPSAVALTLGKEASFVECLQEHSTKKLTKGPAGRPFAEYRLVDTRQRGYLFAECIRWHSAKAPSPLPGVVTVAFLCRVPSDTRQSLCRVPDKKYSAKKSLPMYCSPSSLCRMSHSTNTLPSVFQALRPISVDMQNPCDKHYQYRMNYF